MSNKVQAPCAPNSDRSRCRPAAPDDQQAPPCRDRTRKRIALVHPLAAPSWTAPANHLSIPRNHGSPLVSTRVLQHIPPQSGHSADMLACPLFDNRVLTRRGKSKASLPSPMLINCTQTELDATGRRSRLGTWPTRNGLMPAGQVGELWSDFYVCQTTADVDCDQRGDVGDRETVASDKLVPA